MRYAVVADIHSNLEAFRAVLSDLERRGGCDELWCLGDIVGYGPDPHACIELLRRHKGLCVAGNHDWAATGKLDTADFNPEAAAAARWTAGQLAPEDADFLNSLPLEAGKEGFTLVHGSPREPLWEYMLNVNSARENFAYLKTPYCLAGHTHSPLVFREAESGVSLEPFAPGDKVKLGEERLIINPGGVGQPRDGDARASYAVYDSRAATVELFRVEYDIAAVQSSMKQKGLPLRLIIRLSYGI